MCVSARGIFSCKGINTLLLQFGLRVVSYSVMMFVRKKLPQQFGVRQWDSLDVTSGPDSGQRLITLELKVPTLPRKKIQRRGTVSRCWDRRDRPLESKRTQVAQNDISGKKQLN